MEDGQASTHRRCPSYHSWAPITKGKGWSHGMGTMVYSVHRVAYRRLTAALLLAILLTGVSLPVALAHAVVVRSDPPDNGVVSKSPPRDSSLVQRGHLTAAHAGPGAQCAGAKRCQRPRRTVDPSDPTLLVVTVPELPDGIYNVVYTALSAADGHATQGHIVFQVGAAVETRLPAGSTSQPAVSFPEVLLRWLNFLSLAAVTGAVAVAFVLLRPNRLRDAGTQPVAAQLAQARQRVLRWGGWCALVALALGIALLLWQAALFALPGGNSGGAAQRSWSAALRLLGDAQSGTLWMFRQALLLVIAFLLFTLAGRPAAIQLDHDPRGAGADSRAVLPGVAHHPGTYPATRQPRRAGNDDRRPGRCAASCGGQPVGWRTYWPWPLAS